MSKNLGSKDDNIITKRYVQYIDDPKNSSALAMIHEMSNKAKRMGKSPAIIHKRRMKVEEPIIKETNNDTNFKRRTMHFATVKSQNINLFNNRRKESDKQIVPEKEKEKVNTSSNTNKYTGTQYKTEYVWDKNINRLVEKKVPINKPQAEEKPVRQEKRVEYKPKIQERKVETQPKVQERKVETQPKIQERKVESHHKVLERKIEHQPKVQERRAEPQTKPQIKKKIEGIEEIKEDQDKEEKGEIIEKLKEYRKTKGNEGKKKKIHVQVPKGNEKFNEIVYERRIVNDGEDDDEDVDFEKEVSGKNTKIYKKIVKNEPGSKVVITKKVIEESTQENKLSFNDSSDEEDIQRELKKLNIDPSDYSKGNVKVKVITEEYDEKGNKIYSKEITTNKLPRGMKGNNEIMDEFEKFEDEFDE